MYDAGEISMCGARRLRTGGQQDLPVATCSVILQAVAACNGAPRMSVRPMAAAQAEAAAAPASSGAAQPLMLRALRGEAVERPPVWMMRQAGRYMKVRSKIAAGIAPVMLDCDPNAHLPPAHCPVHQCTPTHPRSCTPHPLPPAGCTIPQVYQDLCKKHTTFRERSENVDLAVRGGIRSPCLLAACLVGPLQRCAVERCAALLPPCALTTDCRNHAAVLPPLALTLSASSVSDHGYDCYLSATADLCPCAPLPSPAPPATHQVEISLQPWRAFRPDGVILFSDILTPLPGMNIPFDITAGKGPIIADPIRTMKQVEEVTRLDAASACPFVAEALRALRTEVGDEAAVLGFVGAPFTLATYIVEGGSSKNFAAIKRMAFAEPAVLHALLGKLADNVADYVRYQVCILKYT